MNIEFRARWIPVKELPWPEALVSRCHSGLELLVRKVLAELGRRLRIAVRTDAMTERSIAALTDITFDTYPRLVLISNLLAVNARGQDSFKRLHAVLQ